MFLSGRSLRLIRHNAENRRPTMVLVDEIVERSAGVAIR